MKKILNWKIILVGLFLPLLVLVSVVPAEAQSGRGSRLCYSTDGLEINVDITDIVGTLFGTNLDIEIGNRCRALGGQWGGVMPQYVGPGRSNAPVQDVNDALGVLVGIIKLAQIVFWVLTVGFGLYAAYLYLFSAGNKESAAQARRVFVYTIIAAILAVLAYAVPGVIDVWLTGS